ncbi:MAG: fatty acid desaturase [Xanthomonadales bacterium]|nr:fatty acid desaturase [Xanthomonadales bacterium]
MTLGITKAFHEPAGLLYHGAAVLYSVAGYALGWLGLFHPAWWVNVLAVLVLGHAMTIAAYLVHECGHNTIFRSNRANAALGRLLGWITGSCYSTFEDTRYAHFRHHVDNDDVVWFMYSDFFDRYPRLVRLIEVLEWAFIPAHEFLMHGLGMISAFVIPQRSGQRIRQAVVIALRVGLFLLILVLAPLAALGYVIAYMLMMHALRFMDAQQHDYDSYPSLYDDLPSRFGGRETELAHTFSNPLSWKHEWINWLTLNFGWHSAHHVRPTVPWYRLRDYYLENVSDDPGSVIPFRAQWHMYWRHRVYRVTHSGGPYDDIQHVTGEAFLAAGRGGKLYGGNAASFLTPF